MRVGSPSPATPPPANPGGVPRIRPQRRRGWVSGGSTCPVTLPGGLAGNTERSGDDCPVRAGLPSRLDRSVQSRPVVRPTRGGDPTQVSVSGSRRIRPPRSHSRISGSAHKPGFDLGRHLTAAPGTTGSSPGAGRTPVSRSCRSATSVSVTSLGPAGGARTDNVVVAEPRTLTSLRVRWSRRRRRPPGAAAAGSRRPPPVPAGLVGGGCFLAVARRRACSSARQRRQLRCRRPRESVNS